jgi:hypothetical protein
MICSTMYPFIMPTCFLPFGSERLVIYTLRWVDHSLLSSWFNQTRTQNLGASKGRPDSQVTFVGVETNKLPKGHLTYCKGGSEEN